MQIILILSVNDVSYQLKPECSCWPQSM